jgi:hypothetical protein
VDVYSEVLQLQYMRRYGKLTRFGSRLPALTCSASTSTSRPRSVLRATTMTNVGGEREDVSDTDLSQKRDEADTRDLAGGSDTGTNQWYVAKAREGEDSSEDMAAGPKPRGFCLGLAPAASAAPAQDVDDSSKDIANGPKPRGCCLGLAPDAAAGEDGSLSILRTISQRLENSTLACVLPSDYTEREGELISAQHYQDLELQTDFVELASFLEDAKAKFFRDIPLDDDGTPLKIKEARFMFENYYPLVPCFLLTEESGTACTCTPYGGWAFLARNCGRISQG